MITQIVEYYEHIFYPEENWLCPHRNKTACCGLDLVELQAMVPLFDSDANFSISWQMTSEYPFSFDFDIESDFLSVPILYCTTKQIPVVCHKSHMSNCIIHDLIKHCGDNEIKKFYFALCLHDANCNHRHKILINALSFSPKFFFKFIQELVQRTVADPASLNDDYLRAVRTVLSNFYRHVNFNCDDTLDGLAKNSNFLANWKCDSKIFARFSKLMREQHDAMVSSDYYTVFFSKINRKCTILSEMIRLVDSLHKGTCSQSRIDILHDICKLLEQMLDSKLKDDDMYDQLQELKQSVNQLNNRTPLFPTP